MKGEQKKKWSTTEIGCIAYHFYMIKEEDRRNQLLNLFMGLGRRSRWRRSRERGKGKNVPRGSFILMFSYDLI